MMTTKDVYTAVPLLIFLAVAAWFVWGNLLRPGPPDQGPGGDED